MIIGFIGSILFIFSYKNTHGIETIKINNDFIKITKYTNRNLYSYYNLAIFIVLEIAPIILLTEFVDPIILPLTLVLNIGTFIGAFYFGENNSFLGEWTNVLYVLSYI